MKLNIHETFFIALWPHLHLLWTCQWRCPWSAWTFLVGNKTVLIGTLFKECVREAGEFLLINSVVGGIYKQKKSGEQSDWWCSVQGETCIFLMVYTLGGVVGLHKCNKMILIDPICDSRFNPLAVGSKVQSAAIGKKLGITVSSHQPG